MLSNLSEYSHAACKSLDSQCQNSPPPPPPYPALWHRTWFASLREPQLFVRFFCAEGGVSLEEEEGIFSLVFAPCSYQHHGTFTFSLWQRHFVSVSAKIESSLFFKTSRSSIITPPQEPSAPTREAPSSEVWFLPHEVPSLIFYVLIISITSHSPSAQAASCSCFILCDYLCSLFTLLATQ